LSLAQNRLFRWCVGVGVRWRNQCAAGTVTPRLACGDKGRGWTRARR
jgi:hypothetical protein